MNKTIQGFISGILFLISFCVFIFSETKIDTAIGFLIFTGSMIILSFSMYYEEKERKEKEEQLK